MDRIYVKGVILNSENSLLSEPSLFRHYILSSECFSLEKLKADLKAHHLSEVFLISIEKMNCFQGC